MPTINQLIAKPRHPLKARNTAPALESVAAETRCMHARLHDDAEEAEFGFA